MELSSKEDAAAKRKAELERKKKKLQEIRNEREQRRQERIGNEETEEVKDEINVGLNEIDKMLNVCGIDIPEIQVSDFTPDAEVKNSDEIPELSIQKSCEKVTSRKVELEVSKIEVFSFFPKESITYSKHTQTVEPEVQELLFEPVSEVTSKESVDKAMPNDIVGETVAAGGLESHNVPEVEKATTGEVVPKLNDEDTEKLLKSEKFCKFVEKNMRYVERALTLEDIFVDYSGEEAELQRADLKHQSSLTLNQVFTNDRLTRKRCVTSIDWSSLAPELLLASYNRNETAHDPFGVCLIWNTRFKSSSPEYDFHCESPLMSAVFAKFQPNYIIGGTYSGQIVLWDLRSGKKTPVQRSLVSTRAHTSPVYCMKMIGSATSHSVVTISNDGKLCIWTLDMLSSPYESSELQHKLCSPVCATALSFPVDETENNNEFLIGSEDGAVYSAIRYDAKPNIVETYTSHQGPITGVDAHRANDGKNESSQLFLTSSFDWTIKLWNMKEKKRLFTFRDSLTYVTDISWSPIHPALFASTDGNGKLNLWNMNIEPEFPVVSVETENILNKMSWHSSGTLVAAGDDMGSIFVYDVGTELAYPKCNETEMLRSTLQDFKYKKYDDEAVTTALRSVYVE